MVDGADLAFLDIVNSVVECQCYRQLLLQRLPSGIAFSHHCTVYLELLQMTMQITPLTAFENYNLLGGGDARDEWFDDPAEIATTDIAVAHLD